VRTQIDRIDHELDLQMKRMAQIQQQVDELRRSLNELTSEHHFDSIQPVTR